VSLSNDPAFDILKTRYVCGWRNIASESYAGRSSAHELENPGFKTSNGAGGHNIQLFFLAPDGTVLHCMPGYWTAGDLALVMNELVDPLYKVWKSYSMSRTYKKKVFAQMQLAFLEKHNGRMARRSRMQGFDAKFEVKNRLDTTDCVHRDDKGQPIEVVNRKGKKSFKMKNTFEIIMGRMAKRPFRPYADFDVAIFSDYGRKQYDKKGDGGGEERMGNVRKKKNKKGKKNKKSREERRAERQKKKEARKAASE
jgi:hypothetical protein